MYRLDGADVGRFRTNPNHDSAGQSRNPIDDSGSADRDHVIPNSHPGGFHDTCFLGVFDTDRARQYR